MRQKPGLKFVNLRGDHFVEVPSHTREDDADLFLSDHWHLRTNLFTNCFCLSSSVSCAPRLSSCCVAASRSDPNCAKAATSLYWASSSLSLPATCFIALIWAAEPTRLTDRPTFIAGRIPRQHTQYLCRTALSPGRSARRLSKLRSWEYTLKRRQLEFQ